MKIDIYGHAYVRLEIDENFLICFLEDGASERFSLEGIDELDCSYNRIRALPHIPEHFTELKCSNNQLVELPSLPGSLRVLECEDN